MGNKIQLLHNYQYIISLENLLGAWQEFVKGKKSKRDVQQFELHLLDNVIALHNDLAARVYCHSTYQAFRISDPKPRHIHKASVRDRLLHHAVYRILYPFFDKTFIADSYSCRLNKGTHKAINHFRKFAYKVSRNHTRTCWVLKCDVKKFFASIDQAILKNILEYYIPDGDILWLLRRIIDSFSSGQPGKGLPLGNLTSQLFCNVYMNEFDQYVKHGLKVKYYIRYADDFVVMSHDKYQLIKQQEELAKFLAGKLKLRLHEDKVIIKSLVSGVDFLGYVCLPHYRVLRTKTKRRIFGKLQRKQLAVRQGLIPPASLNQSIQSYLGVVKHCNGFKIARRIKELTGS
ncbi:MAG: reverse transcriptase/maturase family protein [Patescibacteria group bacterium]